MASVLFIPLKATWASGEPPEVVSRLAASAIPELQSISTSFGAKPRLMWIAWREGDEPSHRAVYLVLTSRTANGAKIVWSTAKQDAYGLSIHLAYSWQYQGQPTLIFTYQMGAAAEELELYGLDRRNRPVLLDRREAPVFSFQSTRGFGIEAVGAPGASSQCFGFDQAGSHLTKRPC